jgi:hypothetical protein
MRYFLLALFTWLLACTSALASSNVCSQFANSLSKQYEKQVLCHCGTELSNLILSLPKGLVLKRVCDLRTYDGHAVDLRKVRVSLDKYDTAGNSLHGEFLIEGKLRMHGNVRFEPSDGGDLWFLPSTPIYKSKTAFEPNFRLFALRQESAYTKFRLPKQLRSTSLCSYAKADVIFGSFDVSVSDSDGAGISPRHIEVLSVSSFLPCNRGE